MNPLLRIHSLGQSIWYDNLGREILKSEQLKCLINEDGVTGVTSNPSIFEKSLSNDRVYDHDLHILVDTGFNALGIYEGLVLEDIKQAADLLLPIYENTEGTDGFVSLEVLPSLAYDRAGTVADAKRLFELVGRKNLMIKVPGTHEGFTATRELIASGININVTLLFSLEQYRNAVAAYLEGIEQWISSGGDPKQVSSAASFFVSRVDSVIDQRVKDSADPAIKAAAPSILGRTAVANAKIAYKIFQETFLTDKFADLRNKGVRPQKIVWASTSTKNADYSDTLYVDELIGPYTINTIPSITLDAYRDHGQPEVTLDKDLESAEKLIEVIAELGIDLCGIMDQLLDDGVKAFADSFDNLLSEIEKKRTRLLRGWGHRSASLGDLHTDVEDTLKGFDHEDIAEKIWSGQTTIWPDDPNNEISRRLGWLFSVETMRGEIERLNDFAAEIKNAGIKDVILLGMGGSSLAAEVFAQCFGIKPGYPQLHVLDTTVPETILKVRRKIDLANTLCIVASKSGGTIEVMSLYKYFRNEFEAEGLKFGDHFIAITDPGTSLGKLAAENGFRKTFLNPPDIGGRFSALSYFGLVPAVLIGVDLERLLMRASQSVEGSGPKVPSLESPGSWMGAIIGIAAQNGKDKLTFVISPPLESFGLWLEQLIAESTGKQNRGIIPIVGERLGNPEFYGDDRLFVYLRLDGDETHDQAVSDLEKAGQPVVTQRIHTPYDLGREMFRWEFSTAIAGVILQINPFDQPNVQESKDITKKLLAENEKSGKLPEGEFVAANNGNLSGILEHFLSKIEKGNYIAMNAFIDPSEAIQNYLNEIRTELRNKYKVATTLGFGPRFLHSTGQIHKGGKNSGKFLEITMDDPEDIAVPGEKYSFAVLKSAQALGDFEALRQKHRHVLRVHLDKESDFENLLSAIRAG